MPGNVMSIEVEPPMLTAKPGSSGSRMLLIFLRLAKSGSQVFFASSGAC